MNAHASSVQVPAIPQFAAFDASQSAAADSHFPIENLYLLSEVVSSWSKSLNNIHACCKLGMLSSNNLEKFAIKDTEFYLDVKILISQCCHDASLTDVITQIERLNGRAREYTYRLISNALPHLNQNEKRLADLKATSLNKQKLKDNDSFAVFSDQRLWTEHQSLMNEANYLYKSATKNLIKIKEIIAWELDSSK